MDPLGRRIGDMHDVAIESRAGSERGRAGESFETLYRRLMPRVYGYVASLLRDQTAAEDVTALAFERAYRRRRSFRPSRGTPESWMFGIARNAALDELRRRRRRADVEVDPVDLGAEPSESAETELRRATVRTAVLSLSPRDRDIVALKFAGGLSNGEIARVLGVSESSAGTRLHRTIEKLRKACHEEV